MVAVTWYNAIRFANWLTNGQKNGDTETGTYTIAVGGARNREVTVPSPRQRAEWCMEPSGLLLPSEDEWYKAAYYKAGTANAGYWTYPTQSDTPPTSQAPPGGANSANYVCASGYVVTGSKKREPNQN